MKTLILLRHAKPQNKDEYSNDHERPLLPAGRKDTRALGKRLVSGNKPGSMHDIPLPDAVLSSTSIRALETAEIITEVWGYQKKITAIKEFYDASPKVFCNVLSCQQDALKNIMIVGHNPALESFVKELTGKDVHLHAGDLAHIELVIDTWNKISLNHTAVLKSVLTPSG